MKELRVIVIALSLLVILSLATVVWAQVSTNFDLSWHVLAGGGGERQSANYLVQDTLGQWAGSISSCGRQEVQTGFWYGVVLAPPPQCKVSLPLTLRNFVPCRERLDEDEPNNNAKEANGPLCSGLEYHGYPNNNDENDYFSIYLATTGTISVTVSNFQAAGDLVLRDSSLIIKARWGGSGGNTMNVIAMGLSSGWYYIQVHVDLTKPYDPTSPYTLRATFP